MKYLIVKSNEINQIRKVQLINLNVGIKISVTFMIINIAFINKNVMFHKTIFRIFHKITILLFLILLKTIKNHRKKKSDK